MVLVDLVGFGVCDWVLIWIEVWAVAGGSGFWFLKWISDGGGGWRCPI